MLELYEFGPTRGLRCRWLLQEMGVPFQSHLVDLKKGEHKRPEFLALNPYGKIPVLKDGDFVLTESVAICNYLAEKFPEKKMISQSGTRERALYDQWVLFAVTELESALWCMEKNDWLYPEEKRSKTAIASAQDDFKQAARILENYLQGKEFLVSTGFSAADVIVGYLLGWAKKRNLLNELPGLVAYLQRLTARPAFPKS